jgi:hypothetical protein
MAAKVVEFQVQTQTQEQTQMQEQVQMQAQIKSYSHLATGYWLRLL